MLELLKNNWKEVVILILFLFIIMFWQTLQSTQKELEKIKIEQTAAEHLKDINKNLDDINKREETLYPQIDANINNINKNIKESKIRLANIEKNQLKKEQVYEDFKKKNIQQISNYLLNSGYSNTIIDR